LIDEPLPHLARELREARQLRGDLLLLLFDCEQRLPQGGKLIGGGCAVIAAVLCCRA